MGASCEIHMAWRVTLSTRAIGNAPIANAYSAVCSNPPLNVIVPGSRSITSRPSMLGTKTEGRTIPQDSLPSYSKKTSSFAFLWGARNGLFCWLPLKTHTSRRYLAGAPFGPNIEQALPGAQANAATGPVWPSHLT